MQRAAYSLTGPIGRRASLGLVVLRVDETVEHDFRRVFNSQDVALYVTRVPSGARLTPATIAAMEGTLADAVGLLPASIDFDAIGYACTSGTTLIGTGRVEALVRRGASVRHVAQPLSAAVAAFERLGARNIGLVSPYVEAVSGPLVAAFAAAGLNVCEGVSFGEEVEARVARIDPASVQAAALDVGARDGVEAVFLSCTNLRTLDIIDGLEERLQKPAVGSNQALAWQMARSAGVEDITTGVGRLMRRRT